MVFAVLSRAGTKKDQFQFSAFTIYLLCTIVGHTINVNTVFILYYINAFLYSWKEELNTFQSLYRTNKINFIFFSAIFRELIL